MKTTAPTGRLCLAASPVAATGARLLSGEFAELRDDTREGCYSLLHHYGATNPVEFFAVATETSFEKPRRMAINHAELFTVLKDYCRIDPRDWQRV